MANIKSAKKRARQNKKRQFQNNYYKTTARTHIKKARKLIAAGELGEAETVVEQAVKALDKAAQKGSIHKNNASRRKSRLVSQLNTAKIQQQA